MQAHQFTIVFLSAIISGIFGPSHRSDDYRMKVLDTLNEKRIAQLYTIYTPLNLVSKDTRFDFEFLPKNPIGTLVHRDGTLTVVLSKNLSYEFVRSKFLTVLLWAKDEIINSFFDSFGIYAAIAATFTLVLLLVMCVFIYSNMKDNSRLLREVLERYERLLTMGKKPVESLGQISSTATLPAAPINNTDTNHPAVLLDNVETKDKDISATPTGTSIACGPSDLKLPSPIPTAKNGGQEPEVTGTSQSTKFDKSLASASQPSSRQKSAVLPVKVVASEPKAAKRPAPSTPQVVKQPFPALHEDYVAPVPTTTAQHSASGTSSDAQESTGETEEPSQRDAPPPFAPISNIKASLSPSSDSDSDQGPSGGASRLLDRGPLHERPANLRPRLSIEALRAGAQASEDEITDQDVAELAEALRADEEASELGRSDHQVSEHDVSERSDTSLYRDPSPDHVPELSIEKQFALPEHTKLSQREASSPYAPFELQREYLTSTEPEYEPVRIRRPEPSFLPEDEPSVLFESPIEYHQPSQAELIGSIPQIRRPSPFDSELQKKHFHGSMCETLDDRAIAVIKGEHIQSAPTSALEPGFRGINQYASPYGEFYNVPSFTLGRKSANWHRQASEVKEWPASKGVTPPYTSVAEHSAPPTATTVSNTPSTADPEASLFASSSQAAALPAAEIAGSKSFAPPSETSLRDEVQQEIKVKPVMGSDIKSVPLAAEKASKPSSPPAVKAVAPKNVLSSAMFSSRYASSSPIKDDPIRKVMTSAMASSRYAPSSAIKNDQPKQEPVKDMSTSQPKPLPAAQVSPARREIAPAEDNSVVLNELSKQKPVAETNTANPTLSSTSKLVPAKETKSAILSSKYAPSTSDQDEALKHEPSTAVSASKTNLAPTVQTTLPKTEPKTAPTTVNTSPSTLPVKPSHTESGTAPATGTDSPPTTPAVQSPPRRDLFMSMSTSRHAPSAEAQAALLKDGPGITTAEIRRKAEETAKAAKAAKAAYATVASLPPSPFGQPSGAPRHPRDEARAHGGRGRGRTQYQPFAYTTEFAPAPWQTQPRGRSDGRGRAPPHAVGPQFGHGAAPAATGPAPVIGAAPGGPWNTGSGNQFLRDREAHRMGRNHAWFKDIELKPAQKGRACPDCLSRDHTVAGPWCWARHLCSYCSKWGHAEKQCLKPCANCGRQASHNDDDCHMVNKKCEICGRFGHTTKEHEKQPARWERIVMEREGSGDDDRSKIQAHEGSVSDQLDGKTCGVCGRKGHTTIEHQKQPSRWA